MDVEQLAGSTCHCAAAALTSISRAAAPAERNGFVFHHTDNQAIESALGRALDLWAAHPREFRALAASGMRADYSWARPGQEYLDIYRYIQHR